MQLDEGRTGLAVPRRLTTDRLVLRQPGDDDLAGYVAVLGTEDGPGEHRDAIAHWRARA